MYRTLFYLFLTTGLRRGEALGLEWTSFTDDGQVEVKQQALNHPGGIVMGPPKSKSGERFVRIPEDTKQLLKAYKDKQAEELGENSKWVFTDSSGRLINPNLIYRRFQSFVRKAGVPRYTLHDLRHWNISNKVADPDLDVATVSSEAGHRNLTMTLDTYSHVLQRAQVRTAKTLEDYGVEKGAVN
jgi:integrase